MPKKMEIAVARSLSVYALRDDSGIIDKETLVLYCYCDNKIT
jgi:hypothetical protein